MPESIKQKESIQEERNRQIFSKRLKQFQKTEKLLGIKEFILNQDLNQKTEEISKFEKESAEYRNGLADALLQFTNENNFLKENEGSQFEKKEFSLDKSLFKEEKHQMKRNSEKIVQRRKSESEPNQKCEESLKKEVSRCGSGFFIRENGREEEKRWLVQSSLGSIGFFGLDLRDLIKKSFFLVSSGAPGMEVENAPLDLVSEYKRRLQTFKESGPMPEGLIEILEVIQSGKDLWVVAEGNLVPVTNLFKGSKTEDEFARVAFRRIEFLAKSFGNLHGNLSLENSFCSKTTGALAFGPPSFTVPEETAEKLQIEKLLDNIQGIIFKKHPHQ